MSSDDKQTCYAIIVPAGVIVRRVYAGGNHHTFQVGWPWRFWGDILIPAIADQFLKQFCTVWHDILAADGTRLATTQVLFGPHVAGLNAFGLPISHFSAPAFGPMTMVSLVQLTPVEHCTIRTVEIPRWAIDSQKPQPAITDGSLIGGGTRNPAWP